MARAFKILVSGPFNSGKTTFIGSISEIEVVSTERRTTGSGGKRRTTVAMDFGRITLRDGDVLHLYGTPGQERFDFMREILSEGMLGYIILVDGAAPATFGEARNILKAFETMSTARSVIAVTRSDRKDCLRPDEIKKALAFDGSETDIVRCDARKLSDVKDVLLSLLERVLEQAVDVEEAEAG